MPLAFNPELVPAISSYFKGQISNVDTIEIGDINNDGRCDSFEPCANGNGNGNGGPGGVNAAPDASGSATSGLTAAPTMRASVQSTTGADVGANLTSPGSTDTSSFNSSAFIEQNAGNLTGSSVQPTDLAGNMAANYELNPLFYQPPSGVNYLTAGRQRTDGGVTWAKANSQDAWKSARRAGFGDRIVGTVIG